MAATFALCCAQKTSSRRTLLYGALTNDHWAEFAVWCAHKWPTCRVRCLMRSQMTGWRSKVHFVKRWKMTRWRVAPRQPAGVLAQLCAASRPLKMKRFSALHKVDSTKIWIQYGASALYTRQWVGPVRVILQQLWIWMHAVLTEIEIQYITQAAPIL